MTVPEEWNRTDLEVYVTERRARAGFETAGPGLLTGVEMDHAAAAELDGVRAIATVGLSNPATLPLKPNGNRPDGLESRGQGNPGTVNLVVRTDRRLSEGTLATLLGVVVEAKTSTLESLVGFSGTTSDAVAVGTARKGNPCEFAGSATPVGDATRAAVRRAIKGSFTSRYDDPDAITAADSGIVTSRRALPVDL